MFRFELNTFTARWEVYRSDGMLMGVFGTRALAKEYTDMKNEKAAANV